MLPDDNLDVAVFRFTLGIPGFDDAMVPRIVGSICLLLLIANHISTGSVVSDSQVGLAVC